MERVEAITNSGVSSCSHSMVQAYMIDSYRRCKKEGFDTYPISRREIYDYQHDGKGEVEIQFDRYSTTANAKGMGFWTGDLNDEKIDSGEPSFDEKEEISSDFFENSTTILKESFENYPSFWEGSRNFVVFTKSKERNPNRLDELELKFWSGYCEKKRKNI